MAEDPVPRPLTPQHASLDGEAAASASGPAVAGPSTQRPRPVPVNPAANGSSSSLSSASSSNQVQQIGSRQGTRSRSRTTRRTPVVAAAAVAQQQQNDVASTAKSGTHGTHARLPSLPRYNSEDHPLSAHKLASRGYHSFSCLGVPFHVPKRYTFLRELGIGAYGCVALARDEEADMNVAIKKVTRVFERDVLARRALREVAILRHMLKNQNCTALVDFDTTFIDFSEIYLVLSASEADLSQIIRSGQALSDAHLQYFAAQLLRGVRYMHAANIIHRDLKPGNLLVNADCALFICDFGLARAFAGPSAKADGADAPQQDAQDIQMADASPNLNGTADATSTAPTQPSPAMPSSPESPMQGRKRTGSGEPTVTKDPVPKTPPPASQSARRPSRIRTAKLDFPGGPVTEYVSTRWYRAPEIMLGFKDGYGTEIDMWSVGCILAELASGRPLFDGKDYVDQIARIHGVLGAPEQSVLDSISSDRARVYVDSLPKTTQTDLGKLLKGASPGLVDLLEKLLIWDPKERLSAAEALKHPWLSAYHGIIDQWERPEPFAKFDEVELINTLPEFKAALQKEAREVKGEYNALFGSSSASDAEGDEGGDAEQQSSGSADDADEDDNGDEEYDEEDEVGEGRTRRRKGNDDGEDSRRNSTGGAAAMKRLSSGSSGPDGDGRAGRSTLAASGSSTSLSTPLRRISETSSGASSDSASYSHHYTTDTGAALSSPITSNAESSAAASAASSTAGDLTLTAAREVNRLRDKGTFARHSLPARSIPATAFPGSGMEGEDDGHAVVDAGGSSAAVSTTDGQRATSAARYRRRAISNAQRYLGGDESGAHAGHGHQVSLDLGAVPASVSLARRHSSQVVTADDGAVADLHTVVGDEMTPPSPQNKIAPSPDFKSFTTDLIARPKSEVGAFTSPSLEAGDVFAQCVASVSRPTSRRGSHSSSCGEASGGATRRKSRAAEEMGGLITAIRAEAEKLRLSSTTGGAE